MVVGRTAGCWGAGPREKGKAAARWAAQTAVGWAMVAVMVVMVVVVAVVVVVLVVGVVVTSANPPSPKHPSTIRRTS